VELQDVEGTRRENLSRPHQRRHSHEMSDDQCSRIARLIRAISSQLYYDFFAISQVQVHCAEILKSDPKIRSPVLGQQRRLRTS
jgi:hypothetical protein